MNTIEAKDIKSQKDRVFYNNIRQTIDHLQNFIVNEAPACTSKEKITDSRSAYKLCKNEETMAVYLKDEMWIADIRVNGRRYRKKFPKKSLAELYANKIKYQKAEDSILNRKRISAVLFTDYAEFYFKTYSVPNKRSAPTDRIVINHLTAYFKGQYLHQITSLMVEQYIAMRLKDVKQRTINLEHQILNHMFKKAIEWGKAVENPSSKIKKFREESGRLRFLDNEEVNRLLKNTPEQIRPIIIVALYTGLRRGELFNLEWKDIDLKRKVLNVIKSKSGKVMEIPMNEFAYNTFLKLKTADNCGKIFNTVNFRKLFAQAVKGAKLNDVIMYTTRHTFASQLVMAGVDLVTVKELLGHSKIEMTMKYAHLSQNHKRQAVEQLASRINISNEEK